MQDCVFCKIISGKIPSNIVWQDENVFAVNDIAPKAPIHLLIIPKQHVVSMLEVNDAQVALSMFKAVQQLKTMAAANYDGFNIVVNNGKSAGQCVFHLHWHFMAGKNLYAGGGIAL